MKYIDEFRDGERARALAAAIAREIAPARSYRFMEFCGGHTHAIARYGLTALLPEAVRLIHGPGCPVCVLPVGRIEQAIRLATECGALVCAYGDCLRVPAVDGRSLQKCRADGGEVRMVYSPLEALAVAQANPQREVVFFAIGFETTTPPTAVLLQQARRLGITNLSVLCCHVLTPPAMQAILDDPAGVALDGFVGPAHVSTVIGSAPYAPFAEQYGKPVVIAGFEPLDVLQAIRLLIRQVNAGVAQVENEFTRAVDRHGNRKAQALVAEVFELRPDFDWRGLGNLPHSALRLRPEYADFDAEQRFAVPYVTVPEPKGCDCPAILRGQKVPEDCRLFGTACTPARPIGSCMVSSEGACAARYTFGRSRA